MDTIGHHGYIVQDHEALVRERDNVERQLSEERVLVEQQKKTMEEMEVWPRTTPAHTTPHQQSTHLHTPHHTSINACFGYV